MSLKPIKLGIQGTMGGPCLSKAVGRKTVGTRVTVGTIAGTRTNGGYDLAVTDFLTERRIRSARPQRRPYKLRDCAGLYPLIPPSDPRLLRLRFKAHGRESMVAPGSY